MMIGKKEKLTHSLCAVAAMPKKVQVIALKDHDWAGQPRKTGETYEVDPNDVRFDALLSLKLATLVDEKVHLEEPPAKRKYNRRDMTAKD
jgi:hypothetical protein